MMQGKFMGRRLTIALLVVSALFGGEARAERLRVCSFSFHGLEESAVFASRLPAEDFEFIDLSPPSPLGQMTPATATSTPAMVTDDRGWLQGVCRNDIRCDVVVLSAEFAGRFFGRGGRSLSLQEMEEASCQRRCDGLFHTPREVFLLACNTLATKDTDMRSPGMYRQVLLDHGFDQASAERVVAMRYGPLGPTFREALRRIFMNVPKVYGFSSVAPTGLYTGPMLEKYFRSVGDYRRHLDGVRRDGPPNRALDKAFGGTSLVETSGLSPFEPASADRDLICALYDERRTVARRLEIVRQIMGRSDLLAFMPSVQVFFDRHPMDKAHGAESRLFEEIKANRSARERILGLVYQLDVSALQLELGRFAAQMGWMTRDKLRALAIKAARELLRRPLTSEVVDVMCEITKHEFIGNQFTSADLPDALFRDAEGIRLISCLEPPGDAVSARLAAALDSDNAELRLWAAHALTRRLPLPDPVLFTVVRHLRVPAPDMNERLRWIFMAQRPLPRDVRSALATEAPELVGDAAAPQRRRGWFR
jgi:hypothetical protein